MDNKSEHTGSTPTDISFQLLEQITNGFSEDHKVGTGGYGQVYKGVYNGDEIAVKKLHHMAGLDDDQFKNEFDKLMRVQHQNIVRMVGYCYEIRHKYFEHNGEFTFARVVERALCLEYVEGGSLANYLSDESSGLDWHSRYKIIKGVCEGLNYLHKGSEKQIYHLDLKPENILLDKSMIPKIADFGLSKLFAETQTLTGEKFIGTFGCMPPEYIDKRHISNKFDVFSLGVVIMKIIAGPEGYSNSSEMTPQQHIELVLENWGKRLRTTLTSEEGNGLEVKTCMEIALRCVERERVKRPTITEIVEKLHELDTARRSLLGQSPVSRSKECLAIDPLEVRFPFKLNKEISCVLQLTNRTDSSIAFITKTNQAKYHIQPDNGFMPPRSKRYIIVTLQAQVSAPPKMQCNDIILVKSRRVGEGLTLDNVAEHFDKISVGEVLDDVQNIVDEAKLPIVYIVLPQPQCLSR